MKTPMPPHFKVLLAEIAESHTKLRSFLEFDPASLNKYVAWDGTLHDKPVAPSDPTVLQLTEHLNEVLKPRKA